MGKIHYKEKEISTLEYKTSCGIKVTIPLYSFYYQPEIKSSINIENVTCKKCIKLYLNETKSSERL